MPSMSRPGLARYALMNDAVLNVAISKLEADCGSAIAGCKAAEKSIICVSMPPFVSFDRVMPCLGFA